MSLGTEKTLGVQKMMENGRRSCSMHDSVCTVASSLNWALVNDNQHILWWSCWWWWTLVDDYQHLLMMISTCWWWSTLLIFTFESLQGLHLRKKKLFLVLDKIGPKSFWNFNFSWQDKRRGKVCVKNITLSNDPSYLFFSKMTPSLPFRAQNNLHFLQHGM